MRQYLPVSEWFKEHPGVRALIVSLPAGGTFLVKKNQYFYLRVALHGVID